MKAFAALWQTVAVVVQVDMHDASSYSSDVVPNDVIATFGFNSSGVTQGSTSNWTWLLSGLNSAYEVRATNMGGTLSAGIVGTWMVLSTSRNWSTTYTPNTPGSSVVTLLLEIRRVSDSVVIDSGTVTITAEIP